MSLSRAVDKPVTGDSAQPPDRRELLALFITICGRISVSASDDCANRYPPDHIPHSIESFPLSQTCHWMQYLPATRLQDLAHNAQTRCTQGHLARRPRISYPDGDFVWKPVFPPMSRSDDQLAPPERLRPGSRILVVDDNPDHLSILTAFLQRAGAFVIPTTCAGEALSTIEEAERNGPPIDLVVTDMLMPDMNGRAFAEAVRSRGWKMPLIACSASVMCDEQAASLSAGCNAFVAKPIQRAALLQTCARWMP